MVDRKSGKVRMCIQECICVHLCLSISAAHCRGQLKYDDTRAEARFRLSASPFKSAGGRQFSRLLAAKLCSSAVVMMDKPCYEVVWRVLATHSFRQFPLHFPSRASPRAGTFQLESTNRRTSCGEAAADIWPEQINRPGPHFFCN